MLFKFYLAVQQERQLGYLREWLEDLEDIADRFNIQVRKYNARPEE
jgi:predicted DNA-binding protein YlxM (UPF0122 family)